MHRPCRRREREGSKKGLCVDWQPINDRLDWDETKQPEYSPWSHDDTDMLISEIRPSWGPIASTPAATMVRSVGYCVNIYKPQICSWYVSTNSYVAREGRKITYLKLVLRLRPTVTNYWWILLLQFPVIVRFPCHPDRTDEWVCRPLLTGRDMNFLIVCP